VRAAPPSAASGPAPRPAAPIAGLDGIRGLAILLVVLWHCAVRTNFPPARLGVLQPLVLAGWSGVDLFFALSGFLITKLILDEERATGALDVRRFYLRRALRILPAFYLVLALNLLVLPLLPAFASVRAAQGRRPLEVASLLTYWSNYYYALTRTDPPPALGVYWSLCVEEHFYLLWPAFLRGVRSPAARGAGALALCLLLPALRWRAGALGEPAAVVHVLSHLRVDSILWGGLGALVFEAAQRRPRARCAVLGLAAAAVMAAFWRGALSVDPTPAGHALGLSALALMASALAVEVAAAPAAPLTRALELAPLRGLGRVSYGMYLLHFQVIDLAAPAVIRLLRYATPSTYFVLAALSLAGTWLAAAALFHLFERRFLALKGRFTPPRAAAAAAVMPAL